MNKAYEFSKEDGPKIEAIEKKFDAAEVEIIKFSSKLHEPIFKERDEALKTVDKFWTKALGNCIRLFIYVDDEDKAVFDHLSSIRVDRSQDDPREASVHMDFEENKYFTNKTLTKSFKVKKDAEPVSNGFDFAENVQSSPIKIDWKSDEVNQSKLRPTQTAEGEFEPGSFFSTFFEHDHEQFAAAIGDAIINEFYPRAIDYYTNSVEEDMFDR